MDPFLLNTDNMTRVEAFIMYLPRRASYRVEEGMSSVKTRLVFNEYLLFNDSEELCVRRVRETSGLKVLGGRVEARAEVVPAQADRKAVLTNVSKETLKTQRKPPIQQEQPKVNQSP